MLGFDGSFSQIPVTSASLWRIHDQIMHSSLVDIVLEQTARGSASGQISQTEVLKDLPQAQVRQLIDCYLTHFDWPTTLADELLDGSI